MLVGSKVDDVLNRKVSIDEAHQFFKQHNCLAYFEVSARDGINIDEVFYTVAGAAFQISGPVIERKNSVKLINQN